MKPFPGEIIHLVGYYPSLTTTQRPIHTPVYTYAKPSTSNYYNHHDHQTPLPTTSARPSWEHETNHISSPSFYPLVHPDEHFGLTDESGYGAQADAVFSHGSSPTFNANTDDDYKPFQGILNLNTRFSFFSHVTPLVRS